MEILVLIKQVPDDSVEIKLDPATGAPKLDGVEAVVNAFDTYALEMAKRYIEDNGGNVPGPLLTGNCSHTFKNAKPFPHRIPACTKKCRQFSFRRQFIALLVTTLHDLLFYIINDFLICAFTCIHSIIPALALSCVIL